MKISFAAASIILLLAGPAQASHSGGDDRSDGKGSSGKCREASYCEDNDFSPDLTDSPVVICLPGSVCHFNPPPSESEEGGE